MLGRGSFMKLLAMDKVCDKEIISRTMEDVEMKNKAPTSPGLRVRLRRCMRYKQCNDCNHTSSAMCT